MHDANSPQTVNNRPRARRRTILLCHGMTGKLRRAMRRQDHFIIEFHPRHEQPRSTSRAFGGLILKRDTEQERETRHAVILSQKWAQQQERIIRAKKSAGQWPAPPAVPYHG